jgi:cytochrome c oxidase cbb3-type subunit III
MSEPEIDEVTGVETTGHEWDGIKELNKPLPKWWLWTFYATIFWAIVMFVLYPAFPTMSGYTKGIMGYSQRATVAAEVAAGRQAQAKFREAIAAKTVAEIKSDPDLLRFASAAGRAAFAENCAPCHGRGAQGGHGYPNLADDDWIWGGKIDAIYQTIRYGIRWTGENTRVSDMPKFGVDKLLEPKQINAVAEYVLSLSGKSTDPEAAKEGKAIFAEQCVACHGEVGKGNQDLGAPNLTDKIWLYGGSKAQVVTSIETGRGGHMPQWEGRLDPVTIKSLAVYVHSLGGGQ